MNGLTRSYITFAAPNWQAGKRPCSEQFRGFRRSTILLDETPRRYPECARPGHSSVAGGSLSRSPVLTQPGLLRPGTAALRVNETGWTFTTGSVQLVLPTDSKGS